MISRFVSESAVQSAAGLQNGGSRYYTIIVRQNTSPISHKSTVSHAWRPLALRPGNAVRAACEAVL